MTIPNILFNACNFFVLPFWILMIAFPNRPITQRIMQSLLYFLPLGLVYLYFYIGNLSPEFFQSLLNPQLAYITSLCENQSVMGWVHFLAVDLCVGRWIYWEGQKTAIPVKHSLLLQFFAGPVGILSHLFTGWIMQTVFAQPQDARNA